MQSNRQWQATGLIDLKEPGGKLRPHVQYSDVVLDLPLARKQGHAAA